jgi:hypothetical protein
LRVQISDGNKYSLPFEIVLEPVVTVRGKAFSNSSTYNLALKYLVADLKFMIDISNQRAG